MTDPNVNHPEILFVDDEAIAVKYFQRAIGGLAPVTTAGSVEEGKRMLDAHADTLSVLVSDQRMPGEYGNELLRYARHTYPHIVRILTTAYSEQEHTIEAINQGQIYRYIKKPWEINELRMELKQAIELAHLRRDHNLLLREKLMVRQKQTVATRIGALHTLCASLTGAGHFQPVESYLAAAALATLVPPEPDWLLMDYADVISAEAARNGDFAHTLPRKFAEIEKKRREAPEGNMLDILVSMMDGKVVPADGNAVLFTDPRSMAEYLENPGNIPVSDPHITWLAYLIWLDSVGLAFELSKTDAGILGHLIKPEAAASSLRLAAWIEHF